MSSQPTDQILDTHPKQPVRRPWQTSLHRASHVGLWLLVISLTALVLGSWGYWAAHRSEDTRPDAIWARAQQDFRAGRYERVDSALARLSRLRAPTSFDRLLRAQLAMARNRIDEAMADLSRVPDQDHMGAQARMLAGQLELRRDRARVAEEAFRAAIRIDPALVQAHRELIYIYGVQLQRAELQEEFLALSKLSDLSFKNVFDWCMLRNRAWEPSEAIPLLERFVTADPEDRRSRLALAENYLRIGRFHDAESIVGVLPDQDPSALVIRIWTALEMGDEERARRLLTLGRHDDPELARFRGRLALSRRDGPSALREFRIAYAADPENRDTIYGLLGALTIVGDETGTQELRQAAANLDRLNALVQQAGTTQGKRDPTLWRRIGAACAALHRDPEARAWYKLAIARDPLDTEAQQALFRLDAVGRDEAHNPRLGP